MNESVSMKVGKASVKITTDTKTYIIPFEGRGSAFKLRTGIFGGWGSNVYKDILSNGVQDATSFISRIKDRGGAILEDVWVDYSEMTRIELVDKDKEFTVSVAVQLEESD